jgi:hypothetical protein
MKAILYLAVASLWLVPSGGTQKENTQPQNPPIDEVHAPPSSAKPVSGESDSGDIEQMRADLERLKALLTQMRTNLAFVQTSQTPLKHQFELEADAWQVIVEQMDRRLKQMEERRSHDSAH